MDSSERVPRTSLARFLPTLLVGVLIAGGITLYQRNQPAAEHPVSSDSVDGIIADIKIDAGSLDEAIKQLEAESGLKIRVGKLWADHFRASGPLHLRLHNVPATGTVRILFNQVSDQSTPDREFWASSPNTLVFDDASEFPRLVRIYPIGDLLDRYAPYFANDPEAQPPPPNANPVHMSPTPPRDLAADEIANDLEQFVHVDEWLANGGAIADLRLVGDYLIVCDTQQGHVQVQEMLDVLRSGGSADGFPPLPPASRYANLDQRIADLDLSSTTLRDAFEKLQAITQANLVVYWNDVAAAGIRSDTPVNLHLHDVTLRQALTMLIVLSDKAGDLAFGVNDNIIRIASGDRPWHGGDRLTRMYDIHELLDLGHAYRRGHAPPQTQPSTQGPIFTDSITGDDVFDSVIRLIEDQVAPDTWRDNGGSEGVIREFCGRLLITQSPQNHQRISQFLRALRTGGAKEGLEAFKTDARGGQ